MFQAAALSPGLSRQKRKCDVLAKGIEIKEAHFPGRAPIDAYGNGGFRFADMSHRGSILCLPSGIYGWQAENIAPDGADWARIWAEAANIDILLIGTGGKREMPAAQIMQTLGDLAIGCEIMDTGAAARSFNILLSEERAVAAVLIAVD